MDNKFARIAVSHGTIGVVADPHEIGNVLGIKGIDYMIRSGQEARFNFLFGAPSCVPAVGGDIETSGAVIDAKDIETLMAREDIGFLAEMMNYPGVLAGDKEVMQKIGCQMKSPFITMAFMCLPVIPDIKMTDKHLMDTKNFKVIYL
jgi:adenine deaminase